MDAAGSSQEKQPLLVIAKFKFEGRNNDELSFAKNDVITVTQQLDGGCLWWEGSLDGRCGWFPADFVGIIKAEKATGTCTNRAISQEADLPKNEVAKLEANRLAFRAQLIQDFLTKERDHLKTIEGTLETLRTLISSEISKETLFTTAISNLTEIVTFKRALLSRFEEQTRKPLDSQRIGKLFLDLAPEMRSQLRAYCEKYCDLVELLDTKNSQLQKKLAQAKTDLKAVVLGLSLVFRHVQKYASILHEIERNTPDIHPDRGNLQRAAQVYLDFHEECEMVRRQREAQLDFLHAGLLQQQFDTDFETKLGKLLYTGKVTVSEGNPEETQEEVVELDRCIAIFAASILLLEVHMPSGGYTLKNRFGTADLVVRQVESENAVQMRKGKDALTVRCVGKRDFVQLMDALRASVFQVLGPTPTKRRQRMETPLDSITSSPKPPPKNNISTSMSHLRLDHKLGMILPDGPDLELPTAKISLNGGGAFCSSPSFSCQSKAYSGWALRPFPPQRAEWLPAMSDNGSSNDQIKMRKGLSAEEQEDALLLKVVEGYCLGVGGGQSSANLACCAYGQRQRNSADSCSSPCGGGPVRRAASYPDHHEMTALARPQLIVAEDEKLFVEEMEGEQLVMKERSLVDTVYALKDQLAVLTKDVSTMSKALEQEQRARRRLEESIRQQANSDTTTMDSQQQHSLTADGMPLALKPLNGNA